MTALFSFLSRSSTSWKVSRKSSSLSAPSGRSGPCSLHSMLWVRLYTAPLAVHCWLSAGGFLSPVHRSRGRATGRGAQVLLLLQPDGARISPSTDSEPSGRQTCWETKQGWLSLTLTHKWKQTSWPAWLCHMVLSRGWTLLWETDSLNQWEPGEWEKTSLHLSAEKGWGLGRGHQRNRKVPASKKITHSVLTARERITKWQFLLR